MSQSEETDDEDQLLSRMDTITNGGLVSLFAVALKQGFSTVFIFIITGSVGASGYGLISAFREVGKTISRSFSGIDVTLSRTLPRYNTSIQSGFICLAYLAIIGFLLVIGSVLFVFQEDIFQQTLFTTIDISIVLYLIFFTIAFSIKHTTQNILKSLKQVKKAELFNSLLFPLFQIGAVVVAVYISPTVKSGLVGLSVGTAISAIFGIGFVFITTDLSVSSFTLPIEAVKDFVTFLIPVSITSILGTLQLSSYPIFIAFYLDSVEAGVFTLSLFLYQFIRWPLFSLNQIIPPVASEVYQKGEIKLLNRIYKHTSLIITMTSVPAFLFIIVYPEFLLNIFSSEFAQYTLILQILSLSAVLASIVGSVGLLLAMTDNERIKTILFVFLTTISLSLIWFLTSRYGVFGLAVGFTISLTLNNFSELILLYYRESLFPFTKKHLYIIGLNGVLFSIGLVSKHIFPTIVSISLMTVSIVPYLYLSYKYILTPLDKKIITNTFSLQK